MGSPNEHDWGGLTLVVKDVKVNATAPGQAGTSISASELTFLDGVTAGTVTASKALVVGASKEIADLGATTVKGALTVGVDDTGHDVKLFGATTGKSLLWDESADKLIVTGTTDLDGTVTVLSGAAVTSASTFNLDLKTASDNKPVRVNSRDYTQASGDSVAAQFTPNQTVNTTGEVFGAQFKPRAAAGIDVAGVNGIGIDSELKSGDGNASADLRGANIYLGATGTGTISGDVVGIRLRHEVAATVSGDSVALDIDDNEGATDWTHFLKLGAALGTHGMTTASDKTGNAKSGTIKVKIGGTLYHIQVYAD